MSDPSTLLSKGEAPASVFLGLVHCGGRLHDVFQMLRSVDATRDGEATQIKGRTNVLARVGISAY